MTDEEMFGLGVIPYKEEEPILASEGVLVEEGKGDPWLALLSKGVASGALNFTDIPKLLELPHQLINGNKRLSPELQEIADKYQIGLGEQPKQSLFDELRERLRPKPDTPAKRIATNATEFAGGVLTDPFGGLVTKGAKTALDAAKAVGKTLGGAATIGGASGVLQEGGFNPIVADILAAKAAPAAGKLTKDLAWNIAGYHPDRINLPAAKAARNLGVDLPADVLSDLPFTRYTGHAAEKGFVFGRGIEHEQKHVRNVLDDYLNGIVDRSGVEMTPANLELNKQLYTNARKALPEHANYYADATNAALQTSLEDLQLTDIANRDTKNVLNQLKVLKREITPNNTRTEVPVKKLIKQKQRLNSLGIDMLDPSAQVDIVPVGKALGEDLANYGIQNPDWYEHYKPVQEMYASMANRKELETLLGRAKNHATGKQSSNKRSKILNEGKDKIKSLIKNEDISTIDDLAELERALYNKELANPNKSGSATTLQMLGSFKDLGTAALGALGAGSAGADTLGTALASAAATQVLPGWYSLINNKHIKDAAINRALKPKIDSGSDLLKYYPVIAGRAANRMNND